MGVCGAALAQRAARVVAPQTHFRALFQKRFRYALRDRKAVCFQLVIPIVALLLGLILLKIAPIHVAPSRALNVHPYNIVKGTRLPLELPFFSNNMTGANGAPTHSVCVCVCHCRHVCGSRCVVLSWMSHLPLHPSVSVSSSCFELFDRCRVGGGAAALMKLVSQSVGVIVPTPLANLTTVYPPSQYTAPCWSPMAAVANLVRVAFRLTPHCPGCCVTPFRVCVQSAGVSGWNQSQGWAMSQWLLAHRHSMRASRYGAFLFNALSPSPADVTSVPPSDEASRSAARRCTLWFVVSVAPRVCVCVCVYVCVCAQLFASYWVLENTTAIHGAPVFMNLANDLLLKWSTGNPNASITIRSAPFPFTNKQDNQISESLSFTAVLFIVIAFSFIPASFAVFVVKEREVNAKHQQLISGTSLWAYWLATFVWDIVSYAVPCILSIVLILAFQIQQLIEGTRLVATIVLFFLYGTSVAVRALWHSMTPSPPLQG